MSVQSRTRGPGESELIGLMVDLLRELGEAREKWGRTDGKLDVFIQQLKVQDDRTTALEVRMNKAENRLHWWGGLGAAFGALLGFGASKLQH